MGSLLKPYKKDAIDNLLASIANNQNYYYFFASRHTPFADDNNPPAVFEDFQDCVYTPLSELLFGKRLTTNNIRYMARGGPGINWVSNTVFTQYTHTDFNLFSENFYTITDEGKVYKCLYNNRGVASTSKPTLTQNSVFQAADGYVWKYLFSVTSTDNTNFATANAFPVVPNANIVTSAVSGLDVIEVIAGGTGYITTTNGTIQEINTTTPALVRIAAAGASTDNNFYNGSSIYITNGTAQGSLRTITSYTVNSTGNWCLLSTAIANLVASSSTYLINPSVKIVGDGTGASAIATVSNGVISAVTVVNNGIGYTRASVSIVANTSYGSGANVVAYVPPIGGHGKNVVQELGCDTFGLNIQISNTESSTIITTTKYRTVGILKNPKSAANTSNNWTANTFSAVMKVTVNPSTVFTNNELVIGQTTGAYGKVAFSNSTVLYLTGEKTFANNEQIVGNTSGFIATINAVSTVGDIVPTSPEVLYLTNLQPVTRSNTATDVFKITFKV